jgi:hypothetical protein
MRSTDYTGEKLVAHEQKKSKNLQQKNGDETILKREMSFEGKLFIDIPNELNKKEIL